MATKTTTDAEQIVDGLSKGDEISVTYDKVYDRGNWTLDVELSSDVREVARETYEMDVRDTENFKRYTVIVSPLGVSVRTNYPNPMDNNAIGTDGEITRE